MGNCLRESIDADASFEWFQGFVSQSRHVLQIIISRSRRFDPTILKLRLDLPLTHAMDTLCETWRLMEIDRLRMYVRVNDRFRRNVNAAGYFDIEVEWRISTWSW